MKTLAGRCRRAAFGALGCLIAVPLVSSAAVFVPPLSQETNPPSLAAAVQTAGLIPELFEVPSGYVLFTENGRALPLPKADRWSQKPDAALGVHDLARMDATAMPARTAESGVPSGAVRVPEPGKFRANLMSKSAFAAVLFLVGVIVWLVFRATSGLHPARALSRSRR